MTKKKRLGRGLDALLSKPVVETVAVSSDQKTDGLHYLPIDLLEKGQYQPRVDMRQDTLESLAQSIQAQGVVQPIVARPLKKVGMALRYEIVAGERRWRAAQMAGLQNIPAIVKDVPDEAAIAMALIENIQRENLNPLEEAQALNRLIDEFDLTHQEAAEAVGRSRAAVSNLLRLLDLSEKVRSLLQSRKLEMGHARALLSITTPTQQFDVANQVVKSGLSVRDTEQLVRRVLANESGKKAASEKSSRDGDIRRLEQQMTDKLGAKVRIDHTKKGAGKLVINYNSLDELDGILKHIN